ncbi:MAG: PQQ-dependent sugar dehydrogenase [Pseudomonadota bacterium]
MIFRLATVLFLVAAPAAAQTDLSGPNEPVGYQFLITPEDLPPPYATESYANSGELNKRPDPPVLNVPDGFEVNIFAEDLDHPRWMTIAPNGDVFLAQTRPGRITVLRDTNGDGNADETFTYLRGLKSPTGMAFRDGYFYVADLEAVWRVPYEDGDTSARQGPVPITGQGALGDPDGHWTRTLVFEPDSDAFYVGIGSRGNVGIERLPRATVQVFRDGALDPETFAAGLRNPVGIDFHPETGELYVVVNERDGYGDDLVPDYFTRIREGEFFGWPYAWANGIPDPKYGDDAPDLVEQTILPDVMFQSHSAPIGMVFYDAAMFPDEYAGDAFVALRGSWNRETPTGYKIVRVPFEDGRPAGGYENFATGFWFAGEEQAQIIGRPAGLAIAADGSLLIADDTGKAVWRISYSGE